MRNSLKLSLLGLVLGLPAFSFVADAIEGFPAEILEKVKAGEIVMEKVTDTELETRYVAKAFIAPTTTEKYVQLAVNHPRYPSLFPEIKEGQTTSVNQDRSVHEYRLRIVLNLPDVPIPITVYPRGRQTIQNITRDGERHIVHEITNYKEVIDMAVENTRLIPHENGILVLQDVQMKIKDAQGSRTFKEKFIEFFQRYLSTFKNVLAQEGVQQQR